MWDLIAERLSGSVIQRGHDFFGFILGDLGVSSVFGEKLANQTVGIFVHSSFPGRIGMRKVDSCIEILGHPGMITKLPAIVIRYRLHTGLVGSEPTGDRLPDGSGRLVWGALEHRILGFPFHPRHEDPTMPFPDHHIPFPVAKPRPGAAHRRTFIDRDLIGDPAPATLAAIALPPRFLTPQGAVAIASRLLILIDILIHLFMTDRVPVFAL